MVVVFGKESYKNHGWIPGRRQVVCEYPYHTVAPGPNDSWVAITVNDCRGPECRDTKWIKDTRSKEMY